MQACLSQYRDRYHDSLNQEAAVSIRAALRRELKPVKVETAEQLETLITSTGLPGDLESPDMPSLPFPAPFSSALPAVRRLPACDTPQAASAERTMDNLPVGAVNALWLACSVP